jgi:hypothetical protein
LGHIKHGVCRGTALHLCWSFWSSIHMHAKDICYWAPVISFVFFFLNVHVSRFIDQGDLYRILPCLVFLLLL